MSAFRACVVATMLLLLPGCALFMADKKGSPTEDSLLPWRKDKAISEHGDGPVLKMARLEASIVSRPLNDARIRRYVWEELDESGLMAPEVRQGLNECGFRVGVAGSATPWALQSLAQEAVAAHRSQDVQQVAESLNQTSIGPAFSLMPNGKSMLEVQSQLDVNRLPINKFAELSTLRDRRGLKCVFEVSVKELNNDWVLLNVLPQIHAGATTTRLSISGASDQLPVRQNIVPLYEQQFTVKLLAGEVAVIGYHENSDWCLGRLFFQPDSSSSGSERLLMIRMAGIDELRGTSDPGFRLNSYGR